MTIAIPVTSTTPEPTPDLRHYTEWTQKKAAAVANATQENPVPVDPGTVETEDRHFTEWQAKPRP